ncbi:MULTISPECIES: helicase-related protein [Aeromonas]|uniref:helicase-related protein n=1 Tax=Aeromonas TaxID=642 RepID=UPI000C770683|nr:MULTISPECIES: helicase-related protein [Aeromonas]AWA04463.1 DEAD/DEAH box helicase [Aeromonas hydrophila subsp. hydrophila]
MSAKLAPWEILGVEQHELPLLLPASYRDLSLVVDDFSQLNQFIGKMVVVQGHCVHQGWASGPKPRYCVQLFDANGNSLSLSLFGTAEQVAEIPHQAHAAFSGEVTGDYVGRCYLNRTNLEPVALIGRVVPVYPALKGRVTREGVFSLMASQIGPCTPPSLQWLRAKVADIPSGPMRAAIGCRTWNFEQLIRAVHWPTSVRQGEACIKILERLAAYVLAYRLKATEQLPPRQVPPLPNGGFEGIPSRVPFPLTGEQILVSSQILAACQQTTPSQSLLLGDVGTGKSYCISLMAAAVVRGGGRVAVMLPSRILVNQMHALFMSLMPELGPAVLDDEREGEVENDKTRLWVGTTGLLFQSWQQPWDLLVVDEQQKFSVEQRERMSAHHIVESTATPICRTMALARWGSSIKIFRLTQAPVERQIDTQVFTAEHRRQMMERVMRTIAGGGQVMVVCPRKEEDPAKGKKSPKSTEETEQASVERVVKSFESIQARMSASLGFTPQIVYATGGREAEENEAALEAMKSREAHILIATSIVETGISLYGLNHVIVYHADRLGAVQLHQLRGRLVRAGGHGYFDLYLPTPASPTTLKRMAILTSCTQGYDVAMADLRLRGCGDLGKGTTQAGAGTSLLPRRPINVDDVENFIAQLDS